MNQYKLLFSGCATPYFPTDTLIGLVVFDESNMAEIAKRSPYKGEWGKPVSTEFLDKELYPMPKSIVVVWLSIVERKFYSISYDIQNTEAMNKGLDLPVAKNDYGNQSYFLIGMAPYGGVAIWIYSYSKSILVEWTHAQEVAIPMENFVPSQPNITIDQYCNFFIQSDKYIKKHLEENGLPNSDMFENYMRQYYYRYVLKFENWAGKWEEFDTVEEPLPEIDYIEDVRFDGTHDRLHDDGLMNFHQAGKPKNLAVKWHIKKSEYTAYFWFEDEEIRAVFDRFYGAHPETKTDFMIRIDTEKNKYELALYRYGLKEPQVISESAYQLLVFKNKFEYYRSDNYNQPKGAWIW